MKTLLAFALFLFATIFTSTADEQINLSFKNSDIREVIALYQRLTGKKVIYSTIVQGYVSVLMDTPVSREKAIELIEKTLFANGFPLVDASDDTIEVVG